MARTLPDEVVVAVGPIRQAGDGWMAKCPAHDDTKPSLSLTVTADEKLLVHCHAGCDQTAVLTALSLDPTVLNGPRTDREWTPHGDATAVYDYRDEDGKLLFQVLRTADKQFPQRRPDPVKKSGWTWNLRDVRRVPFRLPELIKARDDGASVCITEGEKDALALVGHGRVATCNPGGAGKWREEFAGYFVDLDVTIFADKDSPGQAHARAVAASLDGVARRVWVVEPADPHKDIAAHLGAGLGLDQVQITHNAVDDPYPNLAPDIIDVLAASDPDYDWLVPGLLERGERLMITGFEGLGKTVLTSQLAVCLAAGFDPFTFARIDPLKVLVIDCENSLPQSRRRFRPLVQQAARDGRPLERGQLRLSTRPEGIDLPDPDDAAWLLERVVAHKPDVLVLGPLYRLHIGNPNDEETARRLTGAIDLARVRVNCAVILEAHSGHGEWGRHRSVRPVGSSLYLRWPEFGYGLKPVSDEVAERAPNAVEVTAWRGPRDERAWPSRLRRGGASGWPWVEDHPTGLRAV